MATTPITTSSSIRVKPRCAVAGLDVMGSLALRHDDVVLGVEQLVLACRHQLELAHAEVAARPLPCRRGHVGALVTRADLLRLLEAAGRGRREVRERGTTGVDELLALGG